MALESFLINRPRKLRSRTVLRRKRRGGGLPSGLLKRMIHTYGIKRGMKEAWKAHKSGRNPESLPPVYHRRAVKTHRPVVYSGVSSGRWKVSPLHRGPKITNPFGEEVMIVGANPKRKRRAKRRVRHNSPAKPRRRRSYTMKARRNEPTRRYSRRHVRRSRRNPAMVGGLSIGRPMSLFVPAAVGAAGFFAADYLPSMLGTTLGTSPITRIGMKFAVAIGGTMAARRFLGSKNGTAFALGAGINAVNDVLRTYIFKTLPQTGFGTFVRPRPQLGAFVRRPGMGAVGPYEGVRRFPS